MLSQQCVPVDCYADDFWNCKGRGEASRIHGNHVMVRTGGNKFQERGEGDGRFEGGARINA